MDLYTRSLRSPIGSLRLVVRDDGAVVRIHLPGEQPREDARRDDGRCDELARQLDQYFAGRRRRFDLRLLPSGTEFQLAAWRALSEIPFGETRSYQQQARLLGRPSATRAVGAANGRNPLPIVVPCHRVIGKDGSLTGFGGGLACKQWLLAHEAAVLAGHDRAAAHA
ncbi:MAG TPA: methylated-DNA--[protein]-cysteine S-methyltransferase [Planctomycetota bacterium]|nr:methylated-DNA--[protein]-cysteine S-methyltransferase [Planctomycetota bacterium]